MNQIQNIMRKLILFSLCGFALFSFTCQREINLDQFIDAWHQAASDAKFDRYFNMMDSSFVFLGTAPGERWKKDEFAKFSKPYFDQGKAWDFKAKNRVWHRDEAGLIAWFDEDLDTWMEGCRGSGIVKKTKDGWKLMYYNLTVLIENEKIKSFIALRKQPIEKP